MMLRRAFPVVALLVLCLSAHAVPAQHIRRTLTLVDGRVVTATLYGDECFSYYVTDGGLVVASTAEGYILTESTPEEFAAQWQMTQQARTKAPRKIGSARTAALNQHGKKKVPVVLVSFSDKSFGVGKSAEEVNRYYDLYCNGTRDGKPYKGHGSDGSVKEYFLTQSGGEFEPEFQVLGPVELPKSYAYYGKDGASRDQGYTEFCTEAIRRATELHGDWTVFDNDGNGYVDLVIFIFAGMGQNNGGDTNTIWPKEVGGSSTINGIKFSATSSCSENRLARSSAGELYETADGIGVFIHELSHALGLPDFYDTSATGHNLGMDFWSVMDYGNYANNGYTPAGYNAYERDFMGWQPLQEIDGPCTLRIPCFADGGGGYKIVNGANPNEYYVLENRQKRGWDSKLCTLGHGLQVTHVDYVSSRWTANTVNTVRSRQLMAIIPANNQFIGSYMVSDGKATTQQWLASLKGNLYPGAEENHELTDSSTPASTVFTGGFMGKPVYDIQETEDGVITLKFMPLGTLSSPVDLVSSEVQAQQFSASWTPVEHAECYNVRLLDEENRVVQRADSVSAGRCLFSGLSSNSVYRFAVQALNDRYLNSEWAVSDPVQTLADGIGGLPEGRQLVSVFDVRGQFVTECLGAELRRQNLSPGVYIVRRQSEEIRKVLIK